MRTRLWLGVGVAVVAAIAATSASGVSGSGTITTQGAVKYGYFKTPSGNIVCIYSFGKNVQAAVVCRIKSGLKPPPPPRRPGCFTTNDLSLDVTGRAQTGRSICPGEPEGDAGPLAFESVAPVLGYGKTWRGSGGLRCTSAVTGLTCRNKSGHGFFLSRERWRRF